MNGFSTRSARATTVGVCALLGLAAAGCQPGERTARETIERYITAVQAGDLDTLYCVLAGASQPESEGADPAARREDFDAWALSRYEAYETGRDAGGEPFEDAGIVLVKAFSLGRGTFYSLEGTRYGDDGILAADATVRFGYGAINYGSLTPGTTFYLAGDPPGRIVAVKVPAQSTEIREDVLETVRLRFELALAPETPSCPEGWAVVSVRALPDSATTASITWRF